MRSHPANRPPVSLLPMRLHGTPRWAAATLLAAATGAGCGGAARGTGAPSLAPAPETVRGSDVDTLFGTAVADPYRWLEPSDAPEVQAWAEAQDARTRAALDGVPGRDRLEARFRDLLYVDTVSAPERAGDRLFWMRKGKTQEKASLLWREAGGGEPRLLIDPMTLSTDGTVALGDWRPSHNGELLAYKLQQNNADEAELRIRAVLTGQDLPDVITGAKYATPVWNADGTGFYYVWIPPVGGDVTVDQRPGFAQVRFHELGTAQATDPVIFGPTGNAESFVDVDLSDDGHWLFLYVARGWDNVDVWMRDLRPMTDHRVPRPPLPTGEEPKPGPLSDETRRLDEAARAAGFVPLAVGLDAVSSVEAWQDRLYVTTNAGAPRNRVFSVNPELGAWHEIVAESEQKIDHVRVVGGHLVVSSLVKASSRLDVRKLDGTPVRTVALPSIGSVNQISGEPDHDELYYGFASFTQPTEVVRASVATGASERWAQVEIPADMSGVVVEQVTYPSRDGTAITMFLVRSRDAVQDANNPVLLYGYGGFNVDMTPSFSSSVVTWLELGGIFAMPNLRGGGEYGEAWHQAGMLANKQNVFDDFIGAAEYLVREKWTVPARLAIRGGSNGGLLVGAVMTQRPDLFGAVICEVPLLDMVRYHLFGSGRTWIPEYGSAEDATQFATLHAYSPYHHVTQGTRYPALLMMGAANDDRVDPMHARKFTAAVQWATRDVEGAAPAMFRLERNAGHGGADLVKQTMETNTDRAAFAAWQLGIDVTARLPAR